MKKTISFVIMLCLLASCVSVVMAESKNENGKDGQEIMFLDIPWRVSVEELSDILLEKELIENKLIISKAFSGVDVFPQSENFLHEYLDGTVKFQSIDGNGYAGGVQTRLEKLIGGLETSRTRFSFYYGVDSDGLAHPEVTHLYAVWVQFKPSQDGSELVSKLTSKYGKAETNKASHFAQDYMTYTWNGSNKTKLILLTYNGEASFLFYVNTRISDLASSMIEAHPPAKPEDAGI